MIKRWGPQLFLSFWFVLLIALNGLVANEPLSRIAMGRLPVRVLEPALKTLFTAAYLQ